MNIFYPGWYVMVRSYDCISISICCICGVAADRFLWLIISQGLVLVSTVNVFFFVFFCICWISSTKTTVTISCIIFVYICSADLSVLDTKATSLPSWMCAAPRPLLVTSTWTVVNFLEVKICSITSLMIRTLICWKDSNGSSSAHRFFKFLFYFEEVRDVGCMLR